MNVFTLNDALESLQRILPSDRKRRAERRRRLLQLVSGGISGHERDPCVLGKEALCDCARCQKARLYLEARRCLSEADRYLLFTMMAWH